MMQTRRQLKTESMAASAVFLVSLAIGLTRALPWMSWGAQPEFVASVFRLSPGPASASSLHILISKLIGNALPAGGQFPFSLNILSAFLYAAAAAAVFAVSVKVSKSALFGGLAAFMFMMLKWCVGTFDKAGQGAFILPMAAALIMVAVASERDVAKGRNAAGRVFVLAFLCGLASGQHLFFVFASPVLLFFALKRDSELISGYGRLSAGAFLFILGVLAPLALLALRPAFSIVSGEFSPASVLSMLNIPAFSAFGQAFKSPDQAGLFFGVIFDALMKSALARYFPMFAVAAIGFALVEKKRESFTPALLLAAVMAALAYQLSPKSDIDTFVTLILMILIVIFAAGAGEISGYLKLVPAKPMRVASMLFTSLAVFAALWPVKPGGLDALLPRRNAYAMYSKDTLLSLERGAMFMVSGDDDPLLALPAAGIAGGLRRDVVFVNMNKLPDKGYRAVLRRTIAGGVFVPSEKEYAVLMSKVAEFSKAPYDESPSDAVMKERAQYNLLILTSNAMALGNGAVVPVYFDTIQKFVRNTAFNGMVFEPRGTSFRLRKNYLKECIGEGLKTVYKSTGKEKLLPVNEQSFDYVTHLVTTAIKGCDARREGFSAPCVRMSLRVMQSMGESRRGRRRQPDEQKKHENFFPLPEVAEYCFKAQYRVVQPPIESGWKKQRKSRMAMDRMAGILLSSYYTDIGEYAYIHNIDTDMAWLFKTAIIADEANPRARLLLMLLYENSAMHEDAQKQADTLEKLLKSKERSGGLDEYYNYILQDLYQRVGRPSDADKYRKLIQGKSERSLIP